MFCSNCGKEIEEGEKFCGNCGKKIDMTKNTKKTNVKTNKKSMKEIIKNHKILDVTFVLLLIILIILIYQKLTIVKVPDIVGKTVQEARVMLDDLGISMKNDSSYTGDLIITEQKPTYNKDIRKGSEITIKASSEEELQEQEEAEKQQQEENQKIENTIKNQAEYVRNMNQGDVWYSSYSYYGTSEMGDKIYKIIYKTGSDLEHYKEYYHQLVSLTDDLSGIKNSTKLYLMTEINGKSAAGSEKEMEWAAEQIWGNIN